MASWWQREVPTVPTDFALARYLSPELVNDFVTFEPMLSTFHFTPDPTGSPPELCREISFEAQPINIRDGTRSDLVVKVTALTGDNLLQNANGGPRDVGAQLTVPEEDGFADDVLSTDEFVDVPFIICLTQQQPFTFAVDVFGDVE